MVPQPPQLPKQPQQCSSSLSCPKSHSSQPSHGAGGHQRGSRTGRKPLGSTKPCAFSILSLGQICSMPERKLRSPEWICSRVLESKSRFLRCRERNQIHQGVPGWFWLCRFATEANLTNSLQGVGGGGGCRRPQHSAYAQPRTEVGAFVDPTGETEARGLWKLRVADGWKIPARQGRGGRQRRARPELGRGPRGAWGLAWR